MYLGQSNSTGTAYSIPALQAVMFETSHWGHSEYAIFRMTGSGENAALVEIDRYAWEMEDVYEDNSPQWWYHNNQKTTEAEYNSGVAYYQNMSQIQLNYMYYDH